MIKINFLFLLIVMCSITLTAQQPAFPGAEGGGKYALGGRSGSVYEVTNLNDSGAGSLRTGVSQGNRTIVFRVSGVIELKSKLSIKEDNLTIAGQTAPGDGICITGYPVNIRANNIIIRYMRFRMGDINMVEDDAMNCFSGDYKNIIIDHCSMGWSIDEAASFYSIKNFTLQWSIVSESLYDSFHSKGKHGYGGIWGGENASFLHNLIAHHTARTPRFNGNRYSDQLFRDSVEFCNNVIYNWGNTNSVYGGEGGKYNMINNYYKPGPATPGNLSTSGSSNKRNRILNYTSLYKDGTDTIFGGDFYIDGNFVVGYPDVTADNWTKGVQKDSYSGALELIAKAKQDNPYTISDYIPETAEDAYQAVLLGAGAILPKRDEIDARIVYETETGTATYEGDAYKAINSTGISHPAGIIDSQNDVGGLPEYASEPAPLDSDKDGMPDFWELENGLDPFNPDDRNEFGTDGYTRLEHYLNGINGPIVKNNDQELSAASFTVYPNPFNNEIIFNYKGTEPIHSISLYNSIGQVVYVNHFPESNTKVIINHLSAGTYFAKIETSSGVLVKMISKI